MYGDNPNVNPTVPWIGSNTIASVGQLLLSSANGVFGGDSSEYVYYAYNPPLSPNQAMVQGGDSGSPSFITLPSEPGQLYLAGADYVSFNPGTGDTFTSLSLPTLDSDMEPSGFLPCVFTPVTAIWIGSGSSGTWASGGNWSTGSVPADGMTSGLVTTCTRSSSTVRRPRHARLP